MPRTSHKKPYDVNRYLQRIKDFYNRTGRVPKAEECGQWTNKILVKKCGSWDAAVRMATGERGKYRKWTREDFKKLFKGKYTSTNRYPIRSDFTEQENNLIDKHFGSLTRASEELLSGSFRRLLLKIIFELTPPGCNSASTQEVVSEIIKLGYKVSVDEVRRYLNISARENLLTSGKYDVTTWWALTNNGKSYVKVS